MGDGEVEDACYPRRMARLELLDADITRLDVDAIVNAANELMLGGGGVDGAIHAAAGPELVEACRKVPQVRPGVRCPTGEARITPGFRLPARHVIHTVGPVWHGGGHGEGALLAACYRNSLALAVAHGLASIAFPAISCGVYGYPIDDAAAVAVRETRATLEKEASIQRVVLCAFDDRVRDALERAGAARGGGS
ncbi:MAG TPA: O-acetyl-ADP-ribose deacetylase [Polyangiaceae bacterium]|jgi:O-acetyl-ADP-ribose deacetylase (regulator of RNase III)|nr:O-acetyl-ADP-ribose deacetylase [Polyangiaceae bacterium]